MTKNRPHSAKDGSISNQDPEQQLAFIESLKRQWLAMIDALVDPMMIVDHQYRITKANKALAEMANQEVKSVIGQSCHQVFAKRSTPCPGCKMSEVAKMHKAERWQLSNIREGKFFEATSQPVFSADGSLDGIVQVYRDRTEEQHLHEQLLQSEKLASIGLLAGGVAHEINNPLGGILIFSQMLLRELPMDSSHYADAQEIHHAAQRCKAIVQNLLDFARQKPVEQWTEPESINVREVVQSALRFAKVGRLQDNIDIEESWPDADLWVQGDRNKLIQVFLNLIQNAFQAMKDGGHLSLTAYINQSTKTHDQVVTVEVADDGCGMDDHQRKKIFDPFFTTKEPGEGTGLGLSITHSILEEMGARIRCTSAKGKGTRFFLEFPTAKDIQASA